MEQAEYRDGAATLMQWLGENIPHMQQSARSFSSLSDFHLYMRTVSGVSTEYFDSHGHACLAYLEAMKGRYGTRGVPVETKPAATLGDQLRKVLERGKPTPTLDKLENEAEPQRKPLDWNRPTVFDNFPDFTVTSGSNDVLHSLADGIHPTQRMSDSADPLHGSAWLKG